MTGRTFAWLVATFFAVAAAPAAYAEDWESLFDGKTLTGWDGDPKIWSVQDGCITGTTTAEDPLKVNTFLIYRDEELGDFELTLEYKITGAKGNSGIQYRSFEVPDLKWVVGGYQADIDATDTYSGINYGERFRGILANRGQKTVIEANHKPKVLEQFAQSADLQKGIKKEDWNTYRVVAKGFTFTHYINGVKTSECIDEDKEMRRATGLLALQAHVGPPMQVQFKNIKVKKLAGTETSAVEKKNVLLLAGRRSHGFGAHDHTSGCHLLAKLLNNSGLPVQAVVHELEKEGWPSAEKLAAADTIVIYADGGNGHPFNSHIDELKPLFDQGTGLVCIHYGVEVPAGKSGDAFLDWTGGFFEANWSVNPHWTGNFKDLPQHPTVSGVEPFSIKDEWYYHIRFRENLDGVTAILTDLPPKETLSRPDGPHSGNPYVRAAIEKGEPQHVAWAREREGGSRGFGSTGGHYHWNWGHNQFRKLFLNAIVWTAGLDVPANGVDAGTVTIDDLLTHHDEEVPADFNKARHQAMLDEWNQAGTR